MMFLNYTLPAAQDFAQITTHTRADIAPQVQVAIDDHQGDVEVRPTSGQGVLFDFANLQNADWLECAIALDPEWFTSTELHLAYEAQSQHLISVHPALRFGYESGIRDRFSPSPDEVGPIRSGLYHRFCLSVRDRRDLTALHLHLFFKPTVTEFTLYNLKMTGIRPDTVASEAPAL